MNEMEDDLLQCPHCGGHSGKETEAAYYLTPGTVLKKKYMIGTVLGYGGFGVTYIGWDILLGRKLAIKEYFPSEFATRSFRAEKMTIYFGDASQQYKEGLESFIDEARRLAKFNQLSEIVDIYDYFYENDTGYIIMEYLEGETVGALLTRKGTISVEEMKEIMLPVIHGLGEVHKNGIIHRDIAPDNIFITTGGEIKILDFGAARYAASAVSKSLSVILKKGYAPEEQYRSHGEQGPWTDIYAIGATMYRMLTGVKPVESIARKVKDTLEWPSQIEAPIGKNIENAIMNCLNVNPPDRYQDMEQLAQALMTNKTVERLSRQESTQADPSNKTPFYVKTLIPVAVMLVISTIAWWQISGSKDDTMEETYVLAEEKKVVDISGKSFAEAEKMLQDSDLKVAIKGMNYSETIKKDYILSQTPKGGEPIPADNTVYVVMSGGQEEVMIPDLTSMVYEEAAEIIGLQALVLDEKGITEEYSDVIEKGRIVSQTVAPGKRVPSQTKVGFTLSKGNISEETAVLEVPDLQGKTQKKAKKILEELKEQAGFTYMLGKIRRENSDNVKLGRIISQSLAAGSSERTDLVIDLVISEGPKMLSVPNVIQRSLTEAIALLEKDGFIVTHNEDNSSTVAAGHVISQSLTEGTKTPKGTTIELLVSLGPSAAESSDQEPSNDNPSGNSDRTDRNEPTPSTNPPDQTPDIDVSSGEELDISWE
jgi:beta-lactam-binding protein with PASTA domain